MVGIPRPEQAGWLHKTQHIIASLFRITMLGNRNGTTPSKFTVATPEKVFEFLYKIKLNPKVNSR